MYKHYSIKHGSTLGIIASGVCCFLTLILSVEGDYTFLKYLKFQSLFFSIPALIMFLNVKRTTKNNTYYKSSKVCSIIGIILLTFVASVVLTNTISSLNIKENVFGISFIGNVLALVVLVDTFMLIGIIKSKHE